LTWKQYPANLQIVALGDVLSTHDDLVPVRAGPPVCHKVKLGMPAGSPPRLVRSLSGLVAILLVFVALIIINALAGDAVVYRTSWIGNSFGGVTSWVQSSLEAIWVAPDGTVYTNSLWDESGREAGVYRDGRVVGSAGNTHGVGRFGGKAVTANPRYFFLSGRMDSQGGTLVNTGTWPAKGKYWFGISRRRAQDLTAGAPFTGGKGGAGGTLQASFLVVNEVPEAVDASVAGLAANDVELFVSNPFQSEVRVYQAETMALLRTFPCDRPGKLVLGPDGTLWVIQTPDSENPARILQFATDGRQLSDEIDDVIDPRDIAFDATGRLMIAEAGPRQQILFYDVSSSPHQVATFGATGGIYSGTPGQMGDQKLISPVGIGTDSAGNIYVASTVGGSDIRKFSAAGALQWELKGLEFVDVAVADPASDGLEVYTKRQHFTMDYTSRAGKEATWKGMTIQTLKYPTDPRLSFIAPTAGWNSILAVRNIGGRKYMFTTDQFASHLVIYRLEGEIAVPSGIIAPSHIGGTGWLSGIVPQKASFIWRDSNGDGNLQANEFSDVGVEEVGVWGWCIDNQGNIWQARETGDGLRVFNLQGMDTYGNLLYDRAHMSALGTSAPFTAVERVEYDSDTDTMYLSGYTTDHPIGNGYWGQVGTEIARYDKWSTGNRNPRWRIVLPYDPANWRTIKAMAVAGQRVFAGIAASSPTENVYVYDANTGASLGQLLPGSEVGGAMGWIDGAQNVRAYQRSNGEYLVWVEEDAWNKVIMYRLQGSSSVPAAIITAPAAGAIVSGNVTLTATASAGMAGVQFKVDGVYVGAEVTSVPYSTTWNTSTFNNGQHSITATARDAAGNVGTSSPQTVTVQNSTSRTAIRVNAGGPAYTDPQGNVWAAETGFSASNTYSTIHAVRVPFASLIYQTARWSNGPFQYGASVRDGMYSVTLKFAEIYYTQPGQRVFNVSINGQVVLANFDPLVAAGGPGVGVDRQFYANVTGGRLVILFSPVVGQPLVNAIEIHAEASDLPEMPRLIR
jgi:sugar lactone lactonase YvrE